MISVSTSYPVATAGSIVTARPPAWRALGIPSHEKFGGRKTTYKHRDSTDQPAPHNKFHHSK
jgi:hypothetical protein